MNGKKEEVQVGNWKGGSRHQILQLDTSNIVILSKEREIDD